MSNEYCRSTFDLIDVGIKLASRLCKTSGEEDPIVKEWNEKFYEFIKHSRNHHINSLTTIREKEQANESRD